MRWRVRKTNRCFEFISFHDAVGHACSLQQSSAIDVNTEDGLDRPGTSFVWLGLDGINSERMHLDRDMVLQIRDRLTQWLDTGSFRKDGE